MKIDHVQNNSLFNMYIESLNKLAKARKMRKPPVTLSLKKFGPGKFRVEKVWSQNIEKVEEKLKEIEEVKRLLRLRKN